MLNSGQTIANFKIVRKLGEGGMGEVYLAEDQKLHRNVALKTLSADFFGDAERQKRFQREAQTAAQITHAHVMAIYDIGTATDPDSGQELNYIIMEHVEGISLIDYLQQRSYDLASVVRQAEKIASGLAAAHKLNIIHRDIKASNIVVKEDGDPKILDFGLAKPLDPVQWGDKQEVTDSITDQLTKVGNIVGTVSYMSPEQARGDTLDVRSDIFSFGVLLYRMATGGLPFEGSTPVSILAKILESRPEPPHLKNENIPPELERIIEKCLKKDPLDRYQDTRDLVVDLRNLRRQYDSGPTDSISGVTDVSQTIGRARTKKELTGKKQTVLIVLGLILLAALVRLFLVGPGSDGEVSLQAGENSLAILSFENKTGDTTLNWLETGLPEILLTDLAQSGAFNLIGSDRLHDYLRRQGQLNVETITGADMVNAAKALGAATVLNGSIYRFGDNIRIDARLEETASGNILLGAKVVGEDVIALVDSLTGKIAEGLNVPELLTADIRVSDVTSSSTEAYRLYHEGLDLFGLALYDEAVEKFNRALAIDPGFALAYMRIGMTRAFQGRPQEGARYFALAQEHKSRLPLRDKSLLEIYSGFWLDMKYDEAFIRLESFVDNYPDDKEARSIYALTLNVFRQDTAAAFTHLDAVLKIDPTFQLALSIYAQVYEQRGMTDKAIEYVKRIKEYHPDSPSPYLRLADLYTRQRKFDAAITECQIAQGRFPDNTDALFDLSDLHIRKREFDEAKQYLKLVAEKHYDNHYHMNNYYNRLANLANWRGKFRTGLDNRFHALKQTLITGDSSLISNAYDNIAIYYHRFGQPDSAIAYGRKAYQWANPFQRLGYGLLLVSIDYRREQEARPIFEEALEDFKYRMPDDIRPLADYLDQMFEAQCRLDTAAIIVALENLAMQQEQRASGNVREAGRFMVLSGRYEEGIQRLQKFVSGGDETMSGYHYPYTLYLLGVANEGLGKNDEAARYYEEMLEYWGDPEIELREIKDAHSRLAKLTS